MRRFRPAFLFFALSLFVPVADAGDNAEDAVARGRYLTVVSGCNDCHTAGFADRAGDVPESQWLSGNPLGWSGPWGTTYALNLRAYMDGLTPEQWLAAARSVQSRPPMPWFNLRAMTDADLLAIYAFVRHLGPSDGVVPAYRAPGDQPMAPYVQWVLPSE